MIANRSIPRSTVIPELGYADVLAASEWLCRAFGFTVRLRIADHRVQMNVGDGAVVLVQRRGEGTGGGVLVRVEDVEQHHARARGQGAWVVHPPADYPYGERQYSVQDPGGHVWTFSQSVADVAPEAWGGTSGLM